MIDRARLPEERIVGVCRHIAVMAAALLRAKGVPARPRCGFASYFTPGKFDDHWVCEYQDAATGRWTLLDAQLDAVLIAVFKPDFDPIEVPRDRFLVAGEAWARYRDGTVSGDDFGIPDVRGVVEIAQNLLGTLPLCVDWNCSPGTFGRRCPKPVMCCPVSFCTCWTSWPNTPEAA